VTPKRSKQPTTNVSSISKDFLKLFHTNLKLQ